MAARALDIKLIVSDVDGVWTDGKIIYAGESREIKEFNVRDGLGAKLAQRGGVAVALLTVALLTQFADFFGIGIALLAATRQREREAT